MEVRHQASLVQGSNCDELNIEIHSGAVSRHHRHAKGSGHCILAALSGKALRSFVS